ncbi:hypothetical protein [Comamonas sp. lk]|uniref:hypothetical protein n=1 Tax=Comamonas sp. lk TaxID=2201272 RepID=UPI000EB40F1E|nr:hypothetical protein [Comamonas sp. lk]
MTPVQKLKWAILLKAVAFENIADPGAITAENVDRLYDDNNQNWELQDARNEIRCTCQETDFPTPHSRHYECNSVAARMPDGSWVGWNYWYGGGKHGEPEALDWMSDAYDLTCTEEQVMTTKRTFTKVVADSAA